MPSQLEIAYSNFAKMKPAQLKELDEGLNFLVQAQAATKKGHENRQQLYMNPPDPAAVKMLAAYKAYKFKAEQKPVDERQAALMRLKGVPDTEIAKLNSREKWESDQLGAFDKLQALLKPDVTFADETITASAKKTPKPKAEKMDMVRAVSSKPAEAPLAAPAAMGAEGAPAMSAPSGGGNAALFQPQTVMTNQGAVLPPAPMPPAYAAPPVLDDKRLPLGAALGGTLG